MVYQRFESAFQFGPAALRASTDGDDVIVESVETGQSPLVPAGGAGNDIGIYSGSDVLVSGDYLGSYSEFFDDPGDGTISYGDDLLFAFVDGPWQSQVVGDVLALMITAGDGAAAKVELGDDFLFGSGPGMLLSGDAEAVIVNAVDTGTCTLVAGRDTIVSFEGDGSIFGDFYGLTILSGDGHAIVQTGEDVISTMAAHEVVGDAYYFEIVPDNGPEGAGSTQVTFGDDVLVGGMVIYGDVFSAFHDAFPANEVIGRVEFGDDVLTGNEMTTALYGDADQAYFAAVDVVFGDDIIVSGSADEVMTGDYTADQLSGFGDSVDVQLGADRFVFKGSFGDDVITDFNVGLDVVVFSGFGSALSDQIGVTWHSATETLVIDMTTLGGGTLTMDGVAGITETDFIFL